MSLMCPSAGCKAKKGPCMHEIIGIVVIIAVVAYFAFLR
jgi:hypothetical protein